MAKPKKKPGSAASPAPPESGLKLKIFQPLKSPWAILFLLMLLGLGFRLATTRFTPLLYPDSLEYLSLAKEIQSGAFFHADYNLDQGFLRSRRLPPLYSTLLAGFPGLTDSGEYLGGLLSILFSLATFIPAFWLGRRLHSSAAGLVAAGLMSFQWFILRYASPVLTEATFTFFFTLALALGFQAMDRKTPRAFALAGLISSLAYLTRDVGITLVFLIGFFAALRLRLYDHLPWRRLLPLLGVLLAAFALVCFPYWLLIRAHTGRWGLTVQVGNEAITDHILKFGGNRYDRDRLPGLEEGTERFGDTIPMVSPSGPGMPALHKSLPALAFKVLSLSGDYAIQYFKNSGLFLSLFLLVALGGAGVRMLRGIWGHHSDGVPFPAALEELYLWVWILHLVALYALLTPYMVDERYMYPIMIPGMVAVGIVGGVNVVVSKVLLRLYNFRLPTPDVVFVPSPLVLATKSMIELKLWPIIVLLIVAVAVALSA